MPCCACPSAPLRQPPLWWLMALLENHVFLGDLHPDRQSLCVYNQTVTSRPLFVARIPLCAAPAQVSMERVLLRLHAAVFVTGPRSSVGDLVALLTRIPCPQLGSLPPPPATAAAATATSAYGQAGVGGEGGEEGPGGGTAGVSRPAGPEGGGHGGAEGEDRASPGEADTSATQGRGAHTLGQGGRESPSLQVCVCVVVCVCV